MKIRQIKEDFDEYEGLDDTDEFGGDDCIYCGITAAEDEIIDFGGEYVCKSCIHDRPAHEWIAHCPEETIELLTAHIEEELGKEGETFGGSIRIDDNTKGRWARKITAAFVSEVDSTSYDTIGQIAKYFAQKIIKARRSTEQKRW